MTSSSVARSESEISRSDLHQPESISSLLPLSTFSFSNLIYLLQAFPITSISSSSQDATSEETYNVDSFLLFLILKIPSSHQLQQQFNQHKS